MRQANGKRLASAVGGNDQVAPIVFALVAQRVRRVGKDPELPRGKHRVFRPYPAQFTIIGKQLRILVPPGKGAAAKGISLPQKPCLVTVENRGDTVHGILQNCRHA